MTTPQFRGSLYIDGRWSEAGHRPEVGRGRTVDVVNPATEETLCQVAYCGQAETQRAVEAAVGRPVNTSSRNTSRWRWRADVRWVDRQPGGSYVHD